MASSTATATTASGTSWWSTTGKLTRESEVWMESVFNGVAIDWTDDSMIAPGEWFDSRPIPEIVGGNTSDPKLLGEDEHLEKP